MVTGYGSEACETCAERRNADEFECRRAVLELGGSLNTSLRGICAYNTSSIERLRLAIQDRLAQQCCEADRILRPHAEAAAAVPHHTTNDDKSPAANIDIGPKDRRFAARYKQALVGHVMNASVRPFAADIHATGNREFLQNAQFSSDLVGSSSRMRIPVSKRTPSGKYTETRHASPTAPRMAHRDGSARVDRSTVPAFPHPSPTSDAPHQCRRAVCTGPPDAQRSRRACSTDLADYRASAISWAMPLVPVFATIAAR